MEPCDVGQRKRNSRPYIAYVSGEEVVFHVVGVQDLDVFT